MLSIPAQFATGINIPAGPLIWWRCLFGSAIAFALLAIMRKVRVTRIELIWLLITGCIMGFHWWTYFLSIKLSSVAIGILSLFTYPVISVFLESLFFKTKISQKQILGGFGILAGIYFLIPELTLQNDVTIGIAVGLLSAVLFSLRGILTRKHLTQVNTVTTMGYHILFSFLILSAPVWLVTPKFIIPTATEAGLIVILASFFTIGSHGLIVYAYKHFTVSTVGILSGLQLVYGAVIAYLIFNEVPASNFYIGAVIIMGVSVFEMLPERVWVAMRRK